MAHITPFIPKLLKWEGGFSNHPHDRGGITHRGVTLSTWQQVGSDLDDDNDIDANDLQLLNIEELVDIIETHYWNRWRANEIHDQSVAEILVDWLWCSGKPAIRIPQRILGVKSDGIVGPVTLKALNTRSPRRFHAEIVNARIRFIDRIIERDPLQACFRKGWLNRIRDYTYGQTLY